MLTYPNIDPVALSLGPVKVHWYGLMYLLAFLCAWGLASYRAKQRDGWTADMVSDLVFYGALGVVLGWSGGLCPVLRVRQVSGKPTMVVSGLDWGHELPRRLPRCDGRHAVLVSEIPKNMVSNTGLYCPLCTHRPDVRSYRQLYWW